MLELLAPAGSMEALRAAVQNGANAVYLGCGSFNARQGAKNFTPQMLTEAVKYCHVRGVAVHLTLNTLVSDRETGDVAALIKHAATVPIQEPARMAFHCAFVPSNVIFVIWVQPSKTPLPRLLTFAGIVNSVKLSQ